METERLSPNGALTATARAASSYPVYMVDDGMQRAEGGPAGPWTASIWPHFTL